MVVGHWGTFVSSWTTKALSFEYKPAGTTPDLGCAERHRTTGPLRQRAVGVRDRPANPLRQDEPWTAGAKCFRALTIKKCRGNRAAFSRFSCAPISIILPQIYSSGVLCFKVGCLPPTPTNTGAQHLHRHGANQPPHRVFPHTSILLGGNNFS